MKLAGFESRNLGSNESVVKQVIAIPHVPIAGETEEMIRDATDGCGDVDLVGIGTHTEMLLAIGISDRPTVVHWGY